MPDQLVDELWSDDPMRVRHAASRAFGPDSANAPKISNALAARAALAAERTAKATRLLAWATFALALVTVALGVVTVIVNQ